MTDVLAVDPTQSRPFSFAFDDVTVHVERFPRAATARSLESLFDLLIVANMSAEDEARLVAKLWTVPGWSLVPVLYVMPLGVIGIILPPIYREDIDGFALGNIDSIPVQRAIRRYARQGLASRPPAVMGPWELDRASGLLRFDGGRVALSAREVEILAILLEANGAPVSPAALAARAWGATDGRAASDLARRHVSNLRAKLAAAPGAPRVVNHHGIGYSIGRPEAAGAEQRRRVFA